MPHGNTTHGMFGSPTYISWAHMLSRVRHHPDYAGMSLDPAWEKFEAFFAAMGKRPIGTTLERVDNALGYQPGNCVWASRKAQAINRSTTNFVTIGKETLCVSDWARRHSLRINLVFQRLHYGWTMERALTTPVRTRR